MVRQTYRYICVTDFGAVDVTEIVPVTGVFMKNRLCGVTDTAISDCTHYT